MTTASLAPTELDARALGPDLARGFMLLFVALANSHYFLRGSSVLGGYPQDGSALDSVVTWLIATFVDGRAFPMFGLLFGYGVAHVVRRQGPLHDATGTLGGFGYAALLALLGDARTGAGLDGVPPEQRPCAHGRLACRLGSSGARPSRPDRHPMVFAIAAVGQRSMTCYLAQSVVWTVAFTPFLLDLSDTMTVATTALLATGTWLLTVAFGEWMRRTGRRGPFEVLVRRVTYRRVPRPAVASVSSGP